MIKISKSAYDVMIKHAKSCYPQEACGFITGRKGAAESFLPIDNTERSSTSYLMDPKQQMRAFAKMRDAGHDLLGIFHSHVASPPAPSQKDRTMAFYPDVSYVIVSLADMNKPDLKSFRIVDGKDSPEELVIVD